MARTPKYTPAELLELARAAITADPAVTVGAFRKAHQIGSAEANAVLAAARWEARHGHYAALSLEDLPPRYRELVQAPERADRTAELSLDSAPAELSAAVDRALGSARVALGDTIDTLRATARRIIADVETQAASQIRAAETHAQEAAAGLDVSDRQAAEAREETARVRERLTADVLRLSQELREESRARAHAEDALRRADEERQRALDSLAQERVAARSTTTELTRQLADAQKLAGASEIQVRSMEEALTDIRRRLTDATDAASRAQRDAAAAEARAALLESRHAAELLRLREAHTAEVQRLEARVPAPTRRGRRRGTV